MDTTLIACGQCGMANPATAKFCGGCGQPRVVAAPTNLPPASHSSPAARPSPQSAVMAIMLGVLGLLICGPFTSLPGMYMSWLEMQKAQQAGEGQGMAYLAMAVNVAATLISVFGCMLLGLIGMVSL